MRHGSTESVAESKYRQSSSGAMTPVQRRSQTPSLKLSKAKFRERFLGLLAGSVFVPLAIQVTVQMIQSSNGIERLINAYTLTDSQVMRQWVGTTIIRQSPLITVALQGHNEPINETIYLQLNERSSFQQCTNLTVRHQEMYSNRWQRHLYAQAIMATSYNFTFLDGIELISPVVDCSSALIRTNDSTRGQFFFLTRTIANPQNVLLLALTMAVQEYSIPTETQVGSAAVASFTLINDLQSDDVDHHFVVSLGYPFYASNFVACNIVDTGESEILFQLQTIPRDPKSELAKQLKTSYRSGFYLTSQAGRYNIRQQIWLLADSPLVAITTWRWKSKNTSRNPWAWVHLLDTAFLVYALGHIMQQIIIVRQAYSERKLWSTDISDAGAKPFLLRGTFVLFFWCLTSFWDLTEFCLCQAHEIAGIDQQFSFTEWTTRTSCSPIPATLRTLRKSALTLGLFSSLP